MKPSYAPILSPTPPSYVPYRQWPEYAYHTHFSSTHTIPLPYGLRHGKWPLCVEEYLGDEEPQAVRDPGAPARMLTWQRVGRTDVPKGWWQPSRRPSSIETFIPLATEGPYWSSWGKIARNERARWLRLKDSIYRIEVISWEDFANVFERSPIKKHMGWFYVDFFKRKHAQDPAHYFLWGVRHIESNTLVAAMGVVESPTYQSSFYDLGCIDATVKDPVMVGLIDHWFATSRSRDIQVLQMGSVWTPGKPRKWRGFSFFKTKFKPQYIALPPVLVRFVPGKILPWK